MGLAHAGGMYSGMVMTLRKLSKTIFPFVIVVLAATILFVFDSNDGGGPAYVSFSTGERGASLFFDTLRHMGYPVRQGRTPVDRFSSTQDAYIIIQPTNPYVDSNMAEEMITWATMGGRLIFLQNQLTYFDLLLPGGIIYGNLMIYEVGQGIIITGNAREITNRSLIDNAGTGAMLHSIITRWDVENIWFAEYYHGLGTRSNLFTRLPAVVRLVFVQMLLVGIMVVWHLGKRFGNAVPYYEETEREENEHVHALARLYMKIGRGRRSRHPEKDN